MGGLNDFQGTWQALMVVDDGRKGDAEAVRRTRVNIAGDRYTLHLEDYVFHGVIAGLDPARRFGPVDFIAEGQGLASRRSLGIYVLEGDEWTVCVAPPGRERPTSFTPRGGDGHWLYLLKRKG